MTAEEVRADRAAEILSQPVELDEKTKKDILDGKIAGIGWIGGPNAQVQPVSATPEK